MHGKIGRISLDRYSTPVQGLLPNLTNVENPLDKNETDVRVETESISQPSRESSEASRQNFEDPPNNQDQDIV